MVNGNKLLAFQTAKILNELQQSLGKTITIRVWHVALADKAHAWNQYLYGCRPAAQFAFFVDGYVRVHTHALDQLAAAMENNAHAHIATGIPSQGYSSAKLATKMKETRGIHGNLYVIRGTILDTLRQIGFILPLGIYRTDSLLGAAIKFNLDPSQHHWDKRRICVVEEASWDHTQLSLLDYKDVQTYFKRILRQGQGVFEIMAMRRHLETERQGLSSLPETVTEMVNNWMRKYPDDLRRVLVKRPIAVLSLGKVKQKRDWSNADTSPMLICSSSDMI